MSRLVLDRQHVLAILAGRSLAVEFPTLAYDGTRELLRQYAESERTCRCGGGDWRIIRPAADQFLLGLKAARQESPELIRRFFDYVAARKGYRPTVITVQCRYDGKTNVAFDIALP